MIEGRQEEGLNRPECPKHDVPSMTSRHVEHVLAHRDIGAVGDSVLQKLTPPRPADQRMLIGYSTNTRTSLPSSL